MSGVKDSGEQGTEGDGAWPGHWAGTASHDTSMQPCMDILRNTEVLHCLCSLDIPRHVNTKAKRPGWLTVSAWLVSGSHQEPESGPIPYCSDRLTEGSDHIVPPGFIHFSWCIKAFYNKRCYFQLYPIPSSGSCSFAFSFVSLTSSFSLLSSPHTPPPLSVSPSTTSCSV